jgi:hypothetical protein
MSLSPVQRLWRLTGAATVLAILLLLVSVPPLTLSTLFVQSATDVPSAGHLVMPRGFDIVEVDQQDGSEHHIFTADGLVLAVARGPGPSSLLYSVLKRMPGDAYAGADLYSLVDGESQPLLARQGHDQWLDVPSLTAEGNAVIYQVGGTGVERPWIEYARTDGSERRRLIPDAEDPTLSTDGALLAYVRSDDAQSLPTHVLVRSIADGNEQELPVSPLFQAVRAPRFSPDGRQLAFLAVTSPSAQAPPSGAVALLDLFRATAVYAHGPPWDVWSFDLPSRTTQKVATLSEDDPSLAWSPDGQTIAILGANGLWLVHPGDVTPNRLGAGSVGRIEWMP